MSLLFGIFLVLGAVIGGFIAAGGNPLLLWQPSEYVVILGAAAGALCISSPFSVIKKILRGVAMLFRGNPYTKEQFLHLLKTLAELFNVAAQEGLTGIEEHVNTPANSAIFKKNPFLLADLLALRYLTDTMKFMQMAGGTAPHELEALLDQDLEVLHEDLAHPTALLGKVAESLPGLGIVAAVLGIIITMQSISGSAEEVGKHVAAALVGTFLGVLACYGFFQPFSSYLDVINQSQIHYIECIKVAALAYAKGMPAPLAVEFARRVIPPLERPTFEELEEAARSVRRSATT